MTSFGNASQYGWCHTSQGPRPAVRVPTNDYLGPRAGRPLNCWQIYIYIYVCMYTCKKYIYIVIYTYANAYVCMHGLQPQTVRIYPIDAEDKIVGQEWMAVLTGKWLTASCRPFLPWWRDFPLHPQWIKDDKSLKKYHINARINPHSQPTNKGRSQPVAARWGY